MTRNSQIRWIRKYHASVINNHIFLHTTVTVPWWIILVRFWTTHTKKDLLSDTILPLSGTSICLKSLPFSSLQLFVHLYIYIYIWWKKNSCGNPFPRSNLLWVYILFITLLLLNWIIHSVLQVEMILQALEYEDGKIFYVSLYLNGLCYHKSMVVVIQGFCFVYEQCPIQLEVQWKLPMSQELLI